MKLVAEPLLANALSRFNAARARLPAPYGASLLDDPITGRCLRYYLLLTEMPELLEAAIPPEQVFWSRYYWFRRYIHLRNTVCGCDAGLEQQAHQILEYPHPACEPNWNHLEDIEAQAERDAMSELRKDR